jgi:hypothetical protein
MLQFTTFPLYREKAESVTMHEVLALLPDNDLLWRILFLKAIGKAPRGASMQDFEDAIGVGPEGYRLTWGDLLKLSLAMRETWDCLIVATDPGVAIKKDTIEDDGFPNCRYVVDAFDSGTWTVGAESQEILNRFSVFKQD